MANLLETMRQESDSGNSAYGFFLLEFKKGVNAIYNFLEGQQDLAYYRIRIEQNIPESCIVKVYSCNGKKDVIEVFELISSISEYSTIRFGYFVDRDFDPPLNNTHIYETPCHSVENFFTHDTTLENVFRVIYGINEHSNDYNICMSLYNKLFEEFHDYVSPINAWINCYIDKRTSNAISEQTNIRRLTENLFLDVFQNSLERISTKYAIATFDQLQLFFDNSVDVTENEFEEKLAYFNMINRAQVFRGKFEIQFLAKFLHVLKHKLERVNNGICQQSYRHNHRFESNTIMVSLSTFAFTPDGLRAYIRNIAS